MPSYLLRPLRLDLEEPFEEEPRDDAPEERLEDSEDRLTPEDRLDDPEDRVEDPEERLEEPEDRLVLDRDDVLVPEDRLEFPEDRLVDVPLLDDPRVFDDRTGVERPPLRVEVERVLVPLEVERVLVPLEVEVERPVVPRVDDVERVDPVVALVEVERVEPERVLVDLPELIRVRPSRELTPERVVLPVLNAPLLAALAVRPVLITVRPSWPLLVTSEPEEIPLLPPYSPDRPPRLIVPERLPSALLAIVDPRGV
mgnify:FL=1